MIEESVIPQPTPSQTVPVRTPPVQAPPAQTPAPVETPELVTTNPGGRMPRKLIMAVVLIIVLFLAGLGFVSAQKGSLNKNSVAPTPIQIVTSVPNETPPIITEPQPTIVNPQPTSAISTITEPTKTASSIKQDSKQPCSSDSECTMESSCGRCWIRHVNDGVPGYYCQEDDVKPYVDICKKFGVTPKCISGLCRAK